MAARSALVGALLARLNELAREISCNPRVSADFICNVNDAVAGIIKKIRDKDVAAGQPMVPTAAPAAYGGPPAAFLDLSVPSAMTHPAQAPAAYREASAAYRVPPAAACVDLSVHAAMPPPAAASRAYVDLVTPANASHASHASHASNASNASNASLAPLAAAKVPAKIDIHQFYKDRPRFTRSVLNASYGTLDWNRRYGDVYMFPVFYYWMKLYEDVKKQFKKKTWIATLLRSDLWGPDFSDGITPTVDSVVSVLGTSSMKSGSVGNTVRLAQPLLPAVQKLLDDFRQTAVEYLSSVPITERMLPAAERKRGRDDDAGSVSQEKKAPSSSGQACNAAKTMLMISSGESDATTSV